MAKKSKIYIVWRGVVPGIYTDWESCQAQTKGYSGARFKSFEGISREEAQKLYDDGVRRIEREEMAEGDAPVKRTTRKSKPKTAKDSKATKAYSEPATPDPKEVAWMKERGIAADAIAVDASAMGNPGQVEYRGVHIQSGEVYFQSKLYERGTNNIGEFLAIVHAMAQMEREQVAYPIYSDSKTAMAWIRAGKAKTTLTQTPENQELFEHLRRAESWLQSHDYSMYKLYKWDTVQWGEIPADFGRK